MNAEDYAIVVGINQYPGLGAGRALKGAEADAQKFYEWLIAPDQGGVPPDHVQLLLGSQYPAPADPLDSRPFKDDIDRALIKWNMQAGQRVGRRFYFYFAGHGLGLSFEEVALLMANATPNLLGYNLSLSAYRTFLRQAAPFDEVVMLVDCCREIEDRAPVQSPVFRLVTRDERAGEVQDFLAFAARFGKRAFEPETAPGENRGLFTTVLLEALAGQGADYQTGQVTAASLRAYLDRRLPEYAQQFKRSQRPEFEGNATNLVFGTPGAAPWPLVTLAVPTDWPGEVQLLDGYNLEKAKRPTAEGAVWTERLAPGLYQLYHPATQRRQVLVVAGEQVAAQTAKPIALTEGVSFTPGEGVWLDLTAPHWAATLKVWDSELTQVGQGVGQLQLELIPGVYRLEAALAEGTATQVITLEANHPLTLTAQDWPPLEFASAAPLALTHTRHEYHTNPAQDLSRQPTPTLPSGGNSRLFVFVRLTMLGRYPLEVRGLRLRQPEGAVLCDFATGVVRDEAQGFVALTVDLPAGPYLLTWATGESERCQPLWLSANFETQVFVPLGERLYLEDWTVLMAPLGEGFKFDDPEAIATEAVLAGLLRGENVVNPALFPPVTHSPLLGVLAVHALRGAGAAEAAAKLLNELQALVPDFPDVRALQLESKNQPVVFDFPPLLQASARLVLAHAARYPATLPPRSLAAQALAAPLADTPWVAWRRAV